MKEKKVIFLDLDGVFADFYQGTLDHMGPWIDKAEDEQDRLHKFLHDITHDKTKNFFLELKPLEGAKKFFDDIENLAYLTATPVFMLTSVSAKNTLVDKVKLEKKLWVLNNLSTDVITLTSDHGNTKFDDAMEYLEEMGLRDDESTEYILIDDWEKNKEPWESKGGIFVHHITNEQTLKELEARLGLIKLKISEPKSRVIWQTFQGKTVSLDTIDHQHLSNCYWYMLLVAKATFNDPMVREIINEAKVRFNGQMLPYRPHVDFKQEIDFLIKNGHLVWMKDTDVQASIVWKGRRIGEFFDENRLIDKTK